jgi:hypothetical protein
MFTKQGVVCSSRSLGKGLAELSNLFPELNYG